MRIDPVARLGFEGDRWFDDVAALLADSSYKAALFRGFADDEILLALFGNQFDLRARCARFGRILNTDDRIIGRIGGLLFEDLGVA